MSKLWITTRPSASTIVERQRRTELRRRYRELRRAGIVRWHARSIVSGLIDCGRLQVKP